MKHLNLINDKMFSSDYYDIDLWEENYADDEEEITESIMTEEEIQLFKELIGLSDDEIDKARISLKPSKDCRHKWIKSGASPITGEQWWNCELCEIPKEEADKDV